MKFLRNLFNVYTESLGRWADEIRTQRTIIQAVDADRSLAMLKALTGSTILADEALKAAVMLAVVAASPRQIQILVKIIAKGRVDMEDIAQLMATLPDTHPKGTR